jgi:hypothetical protein
MHHWAQLGSLANGNEFEEYMFPRVPSRDGVKRKLIRTVGGFEVALSGSNGVSLVEFLLGWNDRLDVETSCDEFCRRLRKAEDILLSDRPPEILKIPTPT